MHTETNFKEGPNGDEAVNWLWKEWANVLRLRNVGIPTVGFTWYSLTDQVDWDTALREQNGNVNPLGLYDLDRNIRAVGRAYKELIAAWREVLPAQRSEEHTSELQSLMRISYAVFCLKKTKHITTSQTHRHQKTI